MGPLGHMERLSTIESRGALRGTRGQKVLLRATYHSEKRLRLAVAGLLCFSLFTLRLCADGGAATPNLAQPARAWADTAAAAQEHILQTDGEIPLMYRVRKTDARGDSTRVTLESRDGAVARTIERNGQPLTPEEDGAERERLTDIEHDPESFLKRHKRDRAGREYALELVRALPGAMLWSYSPGQPQLPHATAPQVVLDFTPDPNFRPPTLVTEGLTGIAGRVWIDAASGCVLRIQGTILHPVDFGWGGMLAKVSQGGTIALEQAQAAPGRWLYTHLTMHLSVREMLIHTVAENMESSASDAKPLPHPISVQEAVQQLLALPVTSR